PLARLHAMCALEGLNGTFTDKVFEKLLKDEHPGVRRHAIRLLEKRDFVGEDLGNILVHLRNDSDEQVRLQLAYSLGKWRGASHGQWLGRLALKVGDNPYLLAAIFSSVDESNLEGLLLTVRNDLEEPRPSETLYQDLLKLASAMGNEKALATLVD